MKIRLHHVLFVTAAIVLAGLFALSLKQPDSVSTTHWPSLLSVYAAEGPATTATSPPTAKGEDYDFTLKELPHKGNVIIDGGLKGTPEQKREIIANAAAHDPFVLHYYLTELYGRKDIPDVEKLHDTNLRIQYHKELVTLLKSSELKSVSLSGYTYFNDGVSGGVRTASQTTYGDGVEGTSFTVAGEEKGTAKNNCANLQHKAAPRAKIVKPSHEGKFVPCPNKRNPAAFQHPQDNPPDLVKPTPGYKRDNGEKVKGDQDAQPKGGTEPTHYGTPGDGAGGETPEASDNGEKAKPPTSDPPTPDAKGETPDAPVPED